MRHICFVSDFKNDNKFNIMLFSFLIGSVIGTIINCNFEFSSPENIEVFSLCVFYQPFLILVLGNSMLGAVLLPVFVLLKGFSISLLSFCFFDYSLKSISLIFAYYVILLLFAYYSFKSSTMLFKSIVNPNFKLTAVLVKRHIVTLVCFILLFLILLILFRIYF